MGMSVSADAIVVTDEKQEQDRSALIEKATKILNKDQNGPKDEKKAADVPPKDSDEGKENPVELSQEEINLAKMSGISESLAVQLHKKGLLEETIASLDLKALSTEESETKPKEKSDKPAEKSGEDNAPELDPELFDETLVKTVTALRDEINALKTQIAGINSKTSQIGLWLSEKSKDIDKFDSEEIKKLENGYSRLCNRYGIDPEGKDSAMLNRAYRILFPDKVKIKDQSAKLAELKKAEGKLINPTKTSSGNVPGKTDTSKTADELDAELKAKVEEYLKKTS
jgi:hypothetical protein